MVMKQLRAVTFPLKSRAIAAACRRLTRAAERGQTPDRGDVIRLGLAWGNLGYAAGFAYLNFVASHVGRSAGPVLECGSGATTVLLGALTAPRQTPVRVLEHNRDWYDYLCRILEALRFEHVQMRYAPLTEYGEFQWYQAPAPADDPFRLVVCDGPPGSTSGGRYGLVPVMRRQLAAGCVILLDDTHRRGEQDAIAGWRRLGQLSASRQGRFGRFAEVSFGAAGAVR